MTEMIAAGTDAQRVLSQILARYSSLDAFIARLRGEFEAPTVELPRVPPVPNWADPTSWSPLVTPAGGHGRHARPDD